MSNLTVEELNLVLALVRGATLQGNADALRKALAVQASALVKLETELTRKSEKAETEKGKG